MKRLSKATRAYHESRGFSVSDSGRVYCDACEALAINGTNCHEAGCPRETYACKGCDNRVARRGSYCEECRL